MSLKSLPAAALALLAAGCATTQLDSQWSDPQFAGQSLRGARLFVVCEAPDAVLVKLCQERLAGEVVAYGATPLLAQEKATPAPGRAGTADAYLPAARAAGARAVLLTSVTPSARVVGSGPSIGIGVGGGGGRVGGGVGISLPIGGPKVSTAYGANTLLTDVASSKLMWTANTSTPATDDVGAQVGELVKAAMGGAGKAGFF